MTGAEFVERSVFEVLEGFGLAQLRAADGSVYGVKRDTPGVEFAELREGRRYRCAVTGKFNRVLRAQVIL